MIMFRKESTPDVPEMSEEEKQEHREQLLTDLIDGYSTKEEEWIEESSPFRDKTNAEKAKKALKTLGVRVLMGAAAAGVTVVFGGIPLVVAASSIVGGLAASYLGRASVDAVHHFSGAEAKEDDIRHELDQKFVEKEKKLALLAKICKQAEAGIPDENGNVIEPEQARVDFINYILEISDPVGVENKEFNEKKKKLLDSQKKWSFIKSGVAIATGVLAGGTIAGMMKESLEHAIREAGIDMHGHGLGKVVEYADKMKPNQDLPDLHSTLHKVKEFTHGDHTDLVFQYNPGEVEKIRQVVQEHSQEFSGQFDSTLHAKELADAGLHETGADLASNFNSEVSSLVTEQSFELTSAALGAVAGAEVVDWLVFRRENEYIGDKEVEAEQNLKNEVSNYSSTAQISTEADPRNPNLPSPGTEFLLNQNVLAKFSTEENGIKEINIPENTRCKFIGVQADGTFLVEPIDEELNKRQDRGRFALANVVLPSTNPAAPETVSTQSDGSGTGDSSTQAVTPEKDNAPKKPDEVVESPEPKVEEDPETTAPAVPVVEEEKIEPITDAEIEKQFQKGAIWVLNSRSKEKIRGTISDSDEQDDTDEVMLDPGKNYRIDRIARSRNGKYWEVRCVEADDPNATVMSIPIHVFAVNMIPPSGKNLVGKELVQYRQKIFNFADNYKAQDLKKVIAEELETSFPEKTKKQDVLRFMNQKGEKIVIRSNQVWEWPGPESRSYEIELLEGLADGTVEIKFKGIEEPIMKAEHEWRAFFEPAKLKNNE